MKLVRPDKSRPVRETKYREPPPKPSPNSMGGGMTDREFTMFSIRWLITIMGTVLLVSLLMYLGMSI
jgi:hypothetical protein